MTVRELMEILATMNPDAEVRMPAGDGYGDDTCAISNVRFDDWACAVMLETDE